MGAKYRNGGVFILDDTRSTIIVTIAYAVVTFLVYSYSCIYAFFIAKQESFMKYKTTQYKLCNRIKNLWDAFILHYFFFIQFLKHFLSNDGLNA